MSVRVEFWVGRHDGIESAFLESLPVFRDWYEGLATDSSSGFALEPLETIDRIRREGRPALLATTTQQACALDAVLDIFVGTFCDWGPGRDLLPPLNQSMLGKRHYEALSGVFNSSGNRQFVSFWHFLIHGRPLARDPSRFPYVPSDPVFRVSFLTGPEAVDIREPMQRLCRVHEASLSEIEAAALKWATEAIAEVAQQGLGLVVTVA